MSPVKEKATERVRLFPSTHRRFKIEAARRGITLAELCDDLGQLIKGLGK